MYPFDKNLKIMGDRIYLRPITKEDTEMVLYWRNSEKTVKNFFYRKPITVEEHTNWLETKVFKGLVHQFIMCMIDGDEPIGSVYIQHFDEEKNEAESGIFTSPKMPSGLGLGEEGARLLNIEYGFKMLHLNRIYATVLGYNIASIKMHERVGFTKYLVKEKDAFLDGKYEDVIIFEQYNKEA